jgi:hypothetical protein
MGAWGKIDGIVTPEAPKIGGVALQSCRKDRVNA